MEQPLTAHSPQAAPAATADAPWAAASRRLLRAALSEYTVLLLSVVYFLVAWARLPELAQRYESSDGTKRYLLRLADQRTIEAVLMPEP